MFSNQQQCLHRGLPFFGIVLSLRQCSDVERGVAQRDQLAPAGQLDWIKKSLIPRYDCYLFKNF